MYRDLVSFGVFFVRIPVFHVIDDIIAARLPIELEGTCHAPDAPKVVMVATEFVIGVVRGEIGPCPLGQLGCLLLMQFRLVELYTNHSDSPARS